MKQEGWLVLGCKKVTKGGRLKDFQAQHTF